MARQIASQALERVSFVKKIPMLKKYTSDDDNPTPGYIYQDINSITFETISSCNSLLDFLISRLKKQSPCIKYKVLKILCYLARNGHSEFRSGLRHKAGVIREAESFTGPIDYLKGDALNQRVRTTASELIGLLFNVESSGMASVHSMMGPTGKKMEGFGNSPHPPAKTKTWLDSVATFAELLPDAANILKPKNNTENLPTSCRPDIAFVNYTDSANASSADFRKFLDGDDSVQSRVSEGEESENVLSMEVHLVDEITCEGGIRNVPSKEALNQFTKRCSSLNIVKVLEALNQRVLQPITEVQLKSLHVLEHLLKSDLPDVVFKISHYCTNLHEISRTESCPVAAKARKILLLIKATVEKEKILQGSAAAQSEKSRISNGDALLDLENIDHGFGSQRSEADDSTTLFSGMSFHMEHSSTSLKQSPVTAQGVQVPSDVLGAFQGLSILSENNISRNNTSTTSDRNPESDIDEVFGLTQTIRSTSSDVKERELANDRVTDLFDPLRNTGAKSSDTLISPVVNPEDVSATRPACSTFAGSIPGPINSSSGSFTFCHDLSHNTYSEPRVTLPENVLLRAGSQNIPHQSIQPSFLSGVSRVRSRHPAPSQGTAFSFVGKSRGSDAFSFVQDEIRARKN
ncbi:AP-4 complex accessory subunit tepsin-like isoform X3 [Montipora foliosa]|uniref:AP-4 complex accessory subunit tepsin-like isoform X3 n=1 Tax=Montipora foliosa TaxID=591990 RepID=UPI0035F19EB0